MSLVRETVYLVDDDELILAGIATFLRDKHFEVRTFLNGDDFFNAFPMIDPSVIVLDMHMPMFSGLDIQRKLLELGNQSPVFFLSGESQSQQIIDALQGGAYEFFLKPVSPPVLYAALQRAFKVIQAQKKSVINDVSKSAMLNLLTPVEHQILLMFLKGHPNKTVAEAMHLKADTIKKRRAHIYEKLQVASLPELLDQFSSLLNR